ncbi:uncharacterized protein OCT59_028160 [Rhizophagus irregularis]|uniref:uncharacterized protein n=1 Tax=Rhizophagus irregularis TaxID=588596 RepID=UPI003320FDFD|nr:hypothetical protein OCT59_028160 [Rhizophagus irregularis]
MVNNKALSPIKQQIIDGDIDWTFTKEWLNSNDQDAPCSTKLSKQQGNRIKKSAHDLHELIITNTKDENFDLDDTIRSSSLFNATFDGVLPQSHPGYLLIHHLVPSDLTKIFYIYIKDKKLRFSLFLKFFSTLMSSIDILIWTRRTSLIKQWESTLFITKNKKRFYRQRQKKRAPPPPAPDVSAHNSSPRRHYNHRHVATTPYYRDGGFYNNHAHIRWTTSNYLHSGYWTTYRDNIGFNNIDLFSILQNSFLKYVFDIR